MKQFMIFLVIAIAVALVTADYTKHDIDTSIREGSLKCLSDPKWNFPADLKDKLQNHQTVEQELMEKLSRCMMTKLGYMSENGDVLKDSMRAVVEPKLKDISVFDKIWEKCYKVESTPEKTAFTMTNCAREYIDNNCGC